MTKPCSPNSPDFGSDAAERVRALIEHNHSLAKIIEEENIAIANSRPDGVAALQPEKARLAAAYAQSIRYIAADRASVAKVEFSLLTQLRAATEGFEARAARQARLLATA